MEDGSLAFFPVSPEHLPHTDPGLDPEHRCRVHLSKERSQILVPDPPVPGAHIGGKNIRTSSCRELAGRERTGGATAGLG